MASRIALDDVVCFLGLIFGYEVRATVFDQPCETLWGLKQKVGRGLVKFDKAHAVFSRLRGASF